MRFARGLSQGGARALFVAEPASIDAGEITDKGYINQRAVLTERADLVEFLESLTDESFVTDPRFGDPFLDPEPGRPERRAGT